MPTPHRFPKSPVLRNALTVYIDESGNSGALRAGLSDPQQPSFVLVGIGDPSDGETLRAVCAEAQREFRFQAKEFKGRAAKRRPELPSVLLGWLLDASVPIFVEIMDLRFTVAMHVVSFVLARDWISRGGRETHAAINDLADLICETPLSNALDSFAAFASNPCRSTFKAFQQGFERAILRARLTEHRSQMHALIDLAEAGLRSASTFSSSLNCAEDFWTFLPPPDRASSGKLVSMLPNINAFANLYARINRFADSFARVRLVHDEQLQFDEALIATAELLDSNRHATDLAASVASTPHVRWHFAGKRFALEFRRSETAPGILLADVLARACAQRMRYVLAGAGQDKTFTREALDRMRGIGDAENGTGVNIVATRKSANEFFRADLTG